MKIMLACGGPNDPTDMLVWTGETDWPDTPRAGDQIRVPPKGERMDLLTVDRVIYEPDGTVYLIAEPADDELHQRLRFVHGWHPFGGDL